MPTAGEPNNKSVPLTLKPKQRPSRIPDAPRNHEQHQHQRDGEVGKSFLVLQRIARGFLERDAPHLSQDSGQYHHGNVLYAEKAGRGVFHTVLFQAVEAPGAQAKIKAQADNDLQPHKARECRRNAVVALGEGAAARPAGVGAHYGQQARAQHKPAQPGMQKQKNLVHTESECAGQPGQ
jgi:hypothetical protein